MLGERLAVEALLVDELLEVSQVSGATEKDQYHAVVGQVLSYLAKNLVRAR